MEITSDILRRLHKILTMGISDEASREVIQLVADIFAMAEQETGPRKAADRLRQERRRERMGVSQVYWEALRVQCFDRDKYTCRYCGSTEGPMHCDHIVAVAKGGSTVIDNLATACGPCNNSKGDRALDEWRPA